MVDSRLLRGSVDLLDRVGFGISESPTLGPASPWSRTRLRGDEEGVEEGTKTKRGEPLEHGAHSFGPVMSSASLEFGTKKNRYWEQKGIATKGARTLRTGLLAVLLGARGCYERSLFGTKKPKTWAVAERKPRAGQRTPRAGLRDTRSEGVAREASEQKRQLFGASHLEKDLYLSSISAYIYIYDKITDSQIMLRQIHRLVTS